MKNMIIAIALFICVLGGVATLNVVLERKSNQLIELCDEMIIAVDNGEWDTIRSVFDEIDATWKSSRFIFFLSLNHTDIDNVDFAVIELNSMIEAEELAHVKNYSENLRFYFDELLDTEQISFENIFCLKCPICPIVI